MMKNLGFPKQMGFALAGIAAAWKTERNFRIQCGCFTVLLIALTVLRPPWVWSALCMVMAVLVMAAELLNTAIEALIDHQHPEVHPAIKTAKDCAAAAVLLLSLGSIGVGAMTVMVTFGVIS